MIVRLSGDLSKKIHVTSAQALPADPNPYADWSARLFRVGRTQYVLLSNTPSLYSVIMFGRGITSPASFTERANRAIRDFMNADGLRFIYEQFVAPVTERVRFGKALNRSVTGSMNKLVLMARIQLGNDEAALTSASLAVNDVLLSALDNGHGDNYGKPRQTFKQLGTDVPPSFENQER